MLTLPTHDKLKSLKLHGMAKAFDEQLASNEYASLRFEERFAFLVDREVVERDNRRLTQRLRQAKLRHQACMENIDYRLSRGLDRSLMKKLFQCAWLKDHLNVIVTGPCGVGKSFLACALGHKACLEGYRVFYTRAPRLFVDLSMAKGDGRYHKLMKFFAKSDLLIIDDWGLSVLTDQERHLLLEVLEDRHGLRSTIVTSQLPVKHWHETIGNATLADAILDRLVHNAYQIQLEGDSLRKAKSVLT